VLGALEPKRADKTIGSSLEAAPHIFVSPQQAENIKGVDLAEVCITSDVQVSVGQIPSHAHQIPDVVGVGVVFDLAKGNKCQRSWKILPTVGKDPNYPDLSPRDADAVRYYESLSKSA